MSFGCREVWAEGLLVGLALSMLLLSYAYVAREAGWVWPESGFRGFAYAAFCERYGADLAPYFSVLAPVLALLAPAVFWARRCYESTFPGIIEFVVFGVAMALVTQAPIFRTLFWVGVGYVDHRQ